MYTYLYVYNLIYINTEWFDVTNQRDRKKWSQEQIRGAMEHYALQVVVITSCHLKYVYMKYIQLDACV